MESNDNLCRRSCSKWLTPDRLMLLLLAAWWLLNVAQAAFTGLANDEAYYWTWVNYGGHLDWGYFDHPPMVAVMIWLTSWMGGSLGIRFASLLLQPLSLYLLWLVVRPKQPTYRSVWLYAGVCFAMPALQLYGMLALPDAPLLCFTVLFLYCYRRMLQRDNMGNALLLGLSMALLAYSKYHGALVVAFAILSNPRLLKSWRLYMAAALALALYAPHLYWQWQHDWVSFDYHLNARHAGFRVQDPLMVIVNMLVFFNPLLDWHYAKACVPSPQGEKVHDEFMRTMRWQVIGFPLFFFVAAFRGTTQVQWLLPAAIGLVVLLCDYASRHAESQKCLLWISGVSLVLFLLVRVVVVANPFGMKGELWDQEKYDEIAALADGRPVVFGGYIKAAKYAYFTGGECYCLPAYWWRHSQWSLRYDDRNFTGREVIHSSELKRSDTLFLSDGSNFVYRVVPNYRPVREVRFWVDDDALPLHVADSMLDVTLRIYNPYPYDIASGEADHLKLTAYYYTQRRNQPRRTSKESFVLPAGDTVSVRCRFRVPQVADGCYPVGFAFSSRYNIPTIQSESYDCVFHSAE